MRTLLKCCIFGLLGLALFLAGCGDDSKGPQNVVINEAQAAQVGAALAEQVGLLSSAFDVNNFFQPIVAAKPGLFTGRFMRVNVDSCGTVTGDLSDSDGDGVPANATITFDLAACTVPTDSGTVSLSGSIRLSDPGPGIGYNLAYTNLQVRFDQGNDYGLIRLNGTQAASATHTTANLIENLTVVVQYSQAGVSGSGSITQGWDVGFATAAGDSIFDFDGLLPSGSFTITGSTAWVFGSDSFSFSVGTVTPLFFDATCQAAQAFTSGQLRARVDGNQGGAYISILYSECGLDPEIRLVPTS